MNEVPFFAPHPPKKEKRTETDGFGRSKMDAMSSHFMFSYRVWAEAPMKAHNGFSVFWEPEGGKKNLIDWHFNHLNEGTASPLMKSEACVMFVVEPWCRAGKQHRW